MPEQLTKHPELTLQVLRSAGARCGEGAPQELLPRCPAARFCKLPGGEVCVYGLADAPRMTQITRDEWRALQPDARPGAAALQTVPLGTFLLAIVVALVGGMLVQTVLGHALRRRRIALARRR